MSGPVDVTDSTWEEEVMNSELPILVDFWAEWCGPCKMLGPVIDELAVEFEGKAKVGKVDIDSNRDAAVTYGIQSIPTILIMKNGEIANKFVGIASKDDLVEAINAAM